MGFIGTVDEGGAIWSRPVDGRPVPIGMDSPCARRALRLT